MEEDRGVEVLVLQSIMLIPNFFQLLVAALL
jgi:hypothetical protein